MEAVDGSVAGVTGRLAVRDYGGAGPDLLLAAGLGVHLLTWQPLAPLLARDFRVVAYDHAGHGLSDPPAAASLESAADDLAAVVAQLGLDTPFLYGHSFGGLVALRYAARGAVCAGVICEDTAIPSAVPDEVLREVDARQEVENDPTNPHGTWVGPAEAFAGFVESIADYWREHGRDPDSDEWSHRWTEFGDHLVRSYRGGLPGEDGLVRPHPTVAETKALTRDALLFIRDELPSAFKSVGCGALIVRGHRGRTRAEAAEAFEAWTAGEGLDVKVQTIDAGHFIHLEQPDVVAALVRTFGAGTPERS